MSCLLIFPSKKPENIMESETEAFPVRTLYSNSSRIYLKPSSLETDIATATFFLHNISYNRQTTHQWLVQGNKDELDKEENQNQHRTWRICSVFSMNNIILLFYYIYFISFICWNPSLMQMYNDYRRNKGCETVHVSHNNIISVFVGALRQW